MMFMSGLEPSIFRSKVRPATSTPRQAYQSRTIGPGHNSGVVGSAGLAGHRRSFRVLDGSLGHLLLDGQASFALFDVCLIRFDRIFENSKIDLIQVDTGIFSSNATSALFLN